MGTIPGTDTTGITFIGESDFVELRVRERNNHELSRSRAEGVFKPEGTAQDTGQATSAIFSVYGDGEVTPETALGFIN